jgi:hypothetical protein
VGFHLFQYLLWVFLFLRFSTDSRFCCAHLFCCADVIGFAWFSARLVVELVLMVAFLGFQLGDAQWNEFGGDSLVMLIRSRFPCLNQCSPFSKTQNVIAAGARGEGVWATRLSLSTVFPCSVFGSALLCSAMLSPRCDNSSPPQSIL